jgi:hypothetical protein
MPSGLLLRHFLNQFVESDLSPDVDRHQALALVAAALVTMPLFAAAFMSLKYLLQPLQAPGWTQITLMGDQMTFCAASLLVSAALATLKWDALSLSARDALILGVLPVTRREIVRAKVFALVLFAATFVIALNALPTLLHPALSAANFRASPLILIPLVVAHAVSTSMAGAFGFGFVVGLRELLFLCLGESRFSFVAGPIRSGLLFAFVLMLVLVPIRLSGRTNWIVEPADRAVLLQPVRWFAAAHGAIAGRVLDTLPEPDLPEHLLREETRMRTESRGSLRHLTALALRGAGALAALLMISLAVYVRNAKRLHVLQESRAPAAMMGLSHAADAVAAALAARPARRAGLLFLIRAMLGNPAHRVYITASAAAGMALLITMAPDALMTQSGITLPVRMAELAAQTLMLTAMVAGFRAAVRTSADVRAAWIFGVAETDNTGEFRKGVRLGITAAVVLTVLLLFPLHAAAWGLWIAAAHTINGAALGWLLVEVACASVEQPLVWTMPPSDGLNTVGVVFLGVLTIAVLVLARVELAALTGAAGTAAFAGVVLVAAASVRHMNERNHRATAVSRT